MSSSLRVAVAALMIVACGRVDSEHAADAAVPPESIDATSPSHSADSSWQPTAPTACPAVDAGPPSSASWQPLPGPWQGALVTSVALSGCTWMVGTTSGVFRSDDGGASFRSWNDGLQPSPADVLRVIVRSVVVTAGRACALTADRLWCASLSDGRFEAVTTFGETENPSRLVATSSGALITVVNRSGGLRLLRSTDGGRTWTEKDLPAHGFLRARGDQVFASVKASTSSSSDDLLISEDGGATWRSVTIGVTAIRDAVVVGGRVIVSSAWGLRVSDDAGVTWRTITGAATALVAVGTHVIAFVSDGTLHSIDGGATWTRHRGRPDDVADATMDATGALLTWGVGLYRSTDRGSTWSELGHGIHAGSFTNVIARGTPTQVWASGDQLLFRSDDYGNTWRSVAGRPVDVDDVCNFVFVGPTLLIANRHRIRRSTDEGATVTDVAGYIGAGTDACPQFAHRGSTVLAIPRLPNAGGPLWRSSDSGATWARPGSFTPPPSIFEAHEVAVDVTRGRFLLATRDGVYRSDDDGITWLRAAPGWGGDEAEGGVERVVVGADGVAYAATEGGSILRSADGGATWTRLTAPTLPKPTRYSPLGFGNAGELLVTGTESARFVVRAQQSDGSFAPYDRGLEAPVIAFGNAGSALMFAATTRGIFVRRDP